jgi:hypothetical protein
MQIRNIARVAHEVNRGLCVAFGDHSQPKWNDAPKWQKESAVNGVRFVIGNPNAGPSAQHEQWLEQKRADGWKYGPVKDADAKTHPCMVPYHVLPVEQQAKDYVFRAIVLSLAGLEAE